MNATGSLRVLLVAPVPPPYGGIANWTRMVLAHSKYRGGIVIEVLNIAPTWRGVHQSSFAFRACGGFIQLVKNAAEAFTMLLRGKYDVIHLTTSGHLACFRDVILASLARLFGVRFVYHVRFGRVPEISRSNSWEWRLMRLAMKLSTVVVMIDRRSYKAATEEAHGSRILLIPNCVEPVSNQSLVEQVGHQKVMLFLGWVVPTKGLAELLRAWETSRPAGWRLDIVGPHEVAYEAELRKQFQVEEVYFLGEMAHPQAMERLAACDIFVLPSHTEGFPNVVLEAMIRGRAIVATDVGAIPEMLEGGAGVVVPTRNANALSNAIGEMMSDAELRKRLGIAAAAKAARRYSLPTVFEEYVDIWRISDKKS